MKTPTKRSFRNGTAATPEATMSQALSIMDSYCAAAGIPCEILPERTSRGVELRVGSALTPGEFVEVSLAIESLPAPTGGIVLEARKVASPLLEDALTEFWKATSAAGWGHPRPVDRGTTTETSIELSVFRHQEWRRSPDVAPETMRSTYDPTITKVVRAFFRGTRRDELLSYGEDEASLLQLGRIIATNFHTLHRKVRLEHERSDLAERNRCCFGAHLKQRLGNALKLWQQRHVNVAPDQQTLSLALSGDDVNASHDVLVGTAPVEEDHLALVDLPLYEACRLSPFLKRKRRALIDKQMDSRRAVQNMDLSYKRMSHNKRVDALSEISRQDSRFSDPAVKSIAVAWLLRERNNCMNESCPHRCVEVMESETQTELAV